MTKFKSEPLDSCDKNLVNTKQSQTIGDYLCGQVSSNLISYWLIRINTAFPLVTSYKLLHISYWLTGEKVAEK